jgi:hypothetical protein
MRVRPEVMGFAPIKSLAPTHTIANREWAADDNLPCLVASCRASGPKVGCFGPFSGDSDGIGDNRLSYIAVLACPGRQAQPTGPPVSNEQLAPTPSGWRRLDRRWRADLQPNRSW